MNTKMKSSKSLWLDYVAVAIIVVVFFVVSYCGFFVGDDIYMTYGISSLSDVFEHTKNWYFKRGGRLFSVASQYVFSGLLGDNRIWFAIMNTLFFVLWIITCGRLIKDSTKSFIFCILSFALLFWFLCPVPKHTLFWAAGSITYLWSNALSFIFLLFFLKYKDDNFGVKGKLGLFVLSLLTASEFITCASICGAFVIYYAFHIKEFKRNAVFFVVGFALGSTVLLFAPGNFERATWGSASASLFDIRHLLHHPVQEMVKYKALWIFLVVLVLGWIKNKEVVKTWVRNNFLLLLSLGWSVIAFSVVFRPYNRALFFTETLSIILFLKFLFDNYGILKIQFIDVFLNKKLSYTIRRAVIVLLFILFVVDSMFAIVETKKQSDKNNKLLNEIVDSGGVVALDRIVSSHRMIIDPDFSRITWKFFADKYDLDSVHIHPFYCLEKYYNLSNPLENVFVDENISKHAKSVDMVVRVENEENQKSNNHVVFIIDYYSRHRTWYESLLDKCRNYHYDLTEVIEREKPDDCFKGYCYYVFCLRRVDAENLKSVKYEIK